MAEPLEAYEFSQRGPQGSKYPWAEWLDGRIWRLDRKADFPKSKAKSLVQSIYREAKERGLKARVTIEDDNTIVMQANPRPDEG